MQTPAPLSKAQVPFRRLLAASLFSLALSACGGGGGSDDEGGGETPTTPTAPSFQTTAKTWSITPPPSGSLCYDFDAGTAADCGASTSWDFQLIGGTAPSFRSNGGVTNSAGSGAAFAFFHWSTLSTWTNATTDPSSGSSVASLYVADSASNIFTSKSWYAYGVTGASTDHLLYPNYRIYLVNANPSDTSAVTYAVQLIGYYGGTSGTASGYPKIRWIDRATPEVVRTETIDATDSDAWVYYDLQNGAIVNLSDEAAATSNAWQIAFRRYDIKLNGGSSGGGTVAGYLGKEIEGFYDASGDPIASKFTGTTPDDTLAALTANEFSTPSNTSGWVKDSQGSVLSPAYTGTYPGALDYGFYSYNPTAGATASEPAHRLTPNSAAGALLRSGDGKSYARLHLTEIRYADPTDRNSQQTWTFEFNVQPAE